MKDQVESIKNSAKKFYTVTDLKKSRLIPWAKDNRTLVKIIEADLEGYNILQATITSDKPYRRYLIARKNLIKYIKTYGPALIGTVRKIKQNVKRKQRGKVSRGTTKKSRA